MTRKNSQNLDLKNKGKERRWTRKIFGVVGGVAFKTNFAFLNSSNCL